MLSATAVKNILEILPRRTAGKLATLQCNSGLDPLDIANEHVKDYMNQAGEYNTNFYPLPTPPYVLIFHNSKNSVTTQSLNEHHFDAETENTCVRKLFESGNFPCKSYKDPTATEIFSAISASPNDENLSGLIVFFTGFANNDTLHVTTQSDTDSSFVRVEDIIWCMNDNCRGKPKVSDVFHSTSTTANIAIT